MEAMLLQSCRVVRSCRGRCRPWIAVKEEELLHSQYSTKIVKDASDGA